MTQSNFDFLQPKWPILARLGELAEKNLYSDPNTTLIKLRIFGETLARFILAEEKLGEPADNQQLSRLNLIKRDGILPDEFISILHSIRKTGNKASHEAYDSIDDAKIMLSFAHHLAIWFVQTYNNWSFEPRKFQLPEVMEQNGDQLKEQINQLTIAYEEENKKLQDELQRLKAVQVTNEESAARRKRAGKAASQLQLTEAETRKLIDAQLVSAGWEADTDNLRYSKGVRPEKGRNIAIAEWPTATGPADYALFVGLKFIGVIEAKKKSKDVVSDMVQAKRYSRTIQPKGNEEFVGGPWGEYRVPFMFATNRRPYLQQLETKSGVWFLDGRKNTNHPRPLHAWYSPSGLLELLKQDVSSAEKKLKKEPFEYLGLRDYQVRAISEIEKALEDGQRKILIAMATGTGKTRTTIGLVYRLIKSKRFKRVLFLVDRSALGEQAGDAFKEMKLEDFHSFTEIFDVKGLDEKQPEPETKVHISTVQGMVKRIMYNEDEESIPTVDTYDCIVVDEAHRGYTLDREMGDVELEFRDQKDYISKYRKVLDYFDAVKIGLTATPAPHTTDIFGKPVYTYSYREAVIDGWLVDHEPPHQIETKLKKEGIKWKKGEKVPIYDPVTGLITNSEELPDELSFEVDKFNKAVITDNFTRTVIKELVKELDPDGEEKTLIFAASDDHADRVVNILKVEFEAYLGAVDDDAITKITGSTDKPLEMIRKFKNEKYPNIAVTVDLLTTGIDVPEICNLVFLRRVRSRILYEQMLGRATRLCSKIKKEHFEIYDAVGLYEALEPVTNMKPVVANPKISFTTLFDELQELEDEAQQKQHIETILAKLQRKQKRLNEEEKQKFETLSGGQTVEEFIVWLRKSPVNEVKAKLQERKGLVFFLDENRYQPSRQFISNHEDKLIEHTRGYGGAKRPEDYLDEFGRFIRENMNKIPALLIACQRPRELTRGALRELKIALDQYGFNEAGLQTAWREMTNEDIAADIISFIRQKALGDALISHEERIKKAMQKMYSLRPWSKLQRKWLERIEAQLIKETVVDKDAFNREPFKGQGGFDKINKIFGGELDQVLDEINNRLYPEERDLA